MVKTKKQRPPTCKENLSSYFSEYCDSTSVHGMRYVGQRDRFVVERLIWLVIIVTVVSLCLYLIYLAYYKWVTQPVIVSFSTTETPIWEIPFPAVTICPAVKSDPEKFNYTAIVLGDKAPNQEEGNLTLSMSLVCSPLAGVLPNITDLLYLWTTPYDDLKEIFADHREDGVSLATWLGKDYPMKNLSITPTSEGLCYTFNMLNPAEIWKIGSLTDAQLLDSWSLLEGYLLDDSNDEFPRRSFIAGLNGGFQITLYTKHKHLDHLCSQYFQGFKVTLHHPSEVPSMDRYFILPLDQTVYAGIKPKMIKVGDELKSYKPTDRNCYFPDEKYLAYYLNYTQNKCLMECLSNYTLKQCNCVGFYMDGADSKTICGPLSNECLEKSLVDYQRTQQSDCDCLPSCTSLEYDIELSQSGLDWKPTLKLLTLYQDLQPVSDVENDHLSQLVVYYKGVQFLPVERHELYGFVDFFSSTGGLTGLFIGISVTSIIEILYFLTLRLGCNIKKFGKRFWSGDPELIAAAEQ